MHGMGRVWQAAGTVAAVLRPRLLEKAVASGLRSLFVGFETLTSQNLTSQHKLQNLDRDYVAAIRRLHDLAESNSLSQQPIQNYSCRDAHHSYQLPPLPAESSQHLTSARGYSEEENVKSTSASSRNVAVGSASGASWVSWNVVSTARPLP